MNSQRSHAQELLDLGPAYYTQDEYDDCLHQLARIGRFLGGDRATLNSIRQLPNRRELLDVGCGGGQFAMILATEFPGAQITGVDLSPQAITFARERLRETTLENVRFEQCSSSQAPFPPDSFDVVTSTLVCHHLTDDELVEFLKMSFQMARTAVVINDLHRHWLAYLLFGLIARLFFRNRLIIHDGLLSIKRAFKRRDWIDYLTAAEIPLAQCSIRWHWAFRWIVRIDTSAKTMP